MLTMALTQATPARNKHCVDSKQKYKLALSVAYGLSTGISTEHVEAWKGRTVKGHYNII